MKLKNTLSKTTQKKKINAGFEISAPEWLVREPVMAAELEQV